LIATLSGNQRLCGKQAPIDRNREQAPPLLEPITLVIPGEAVAFARTGPHGAMHFTPPKQRGHEALIVHEAGLAMQDKELWSCPVSLVVTVQYVVPKSRPKWEQATLYWKTSKPDMDNLLKLAKDALTTVVFEDDSQIAELSARKVYGVKPQTVIRVAPLAGASEAHEPRRETLMAYFRDPSDKKSS
jgi:Holliday junction resolvase RusA-like endonuclease